MVVVVDLFEEKLFHRMALMYLDWTRCIDKIDLHGERSSSSFA